MLTPYRVLDLTDDKGLLCGKMLADLGADVIKIEKPGGDPSRNRGPFWQDIPDPERSLYWWAYNLNKRSITLNIETSDGQEIFKRLVRTADFVIESFRVGYMEEIGLSYSALCQINPKIILTSISPFGQTGPYASYDAPDLVCMAISGHMYLTGDSDRAPLRIGYDQAYLHAAGHAAVGSMVAHNYRQKTGRGQHVDVSVQQCLIWLTHLSVPRWMINKAEYQRAGQCRSEFSGATLLRMVWPCKDGYVTYILIGGGMGSKTNYGLVRWMDSEGMADDFLRAMDWDNFDMETLTAEMYDHIEKAVGKLFLNHTMAEIYEKAVEDGMMTFPALSIKGIAEDQQLEARNLWQQVEHPELGASFTYPGTCIKGTGVPPSVGRMHRAPLIGEHNLDIYEGELGMSRGKIISLKQAGVI